MGDQFLLGCFFSLRPCFLLLGVELIFHFPLYSCIEMSPKESAYQSLCITATSKLGSLGTDEVLPRGGPRSIIRADQMESEDHLSRRSLLAVSIMACPYKKSWPSQWELTHHISGTLFQGNSCFGLYAV
jgi:hypothetical protein